MHTIPRANRSISCASRSILRTCRANTMEGEFYERGLATAYLLDGCASDDLLDGCIGHCLTGLGHRKLAFAGRDRKYADFSRAQHAISPTGASRCNEIARLDVGECSRNADEDPGCGRQ